MSFIRKFAQSMDYAAESRAPVDTDGARPQSGFFEKKLTSLHDLIANPPLSPADLPAFVDAIRNSGGIGLDDRELLLEKVLIVMSNLKDHAISKKIQEAVINLLYQDLPHPVSSYLKAPPITAPPPPLNVSYAYRTANGSHYNQLFPAMGMAGTPYARSVPSRQALPKDSLPDPDLVFDTLLKRDKFVPHKGGMSALFFAFADLVIHSIFKTNRVDWSINDASSYLDLSVLYGHNDADVNAIRRNDGTGRLWNDVFADSRLTHMPPASCALLVLMSRNHNYVAEKILDINEGNKYIREFDLTTKEGKAVRDAQDNEIFHRTRLVNTGYFMHIILGDYVGAILGLARDASDWRLDPMMPMRHGQEIVPLGEGNVVSVEFNLLYRWHATLSAEDTKWTEDMFKDLFDNKDPKDINVNDFKEQAHKKLILKLENVREWSFNGLKRGPDGRFSDDDLARLIQNSTEYRAGAYKARGIPEAMRIIEVMAIKQSRSWGTCSLNEFRKFMNLKPYASFKEWNPDPEIHNAAEALYRDIENLELHVGLQAEQAKLPGDGAGLCPGYTISRAILADAVCLTRGDRFFTTEFTPGNLTSWGFQDCQYDKGDGSFGGLLTKLLLRTLPNHFPRGSAYAHFPFMVPSFLENLWTEKHPELVGKYTWNRPRKLPKVIPIGDYEAVKKVFTDASFLSAYDSRMLTAAKTVLDKSTVKRSMSLRGRRSVSVLPASDKKLVTGREDINGLILGSPESLATYFAQKTKALIKDKKFTAVDGKVEYIDVVRDVINLLPVHWISQQIAGLPLKSNATPQGIWHEQTLYDMFAVITEYIYLNFHPEHDWRLRESTQVHSEKIIEFIKAHVDSVKSWFSLSDTKNHLGVGNDAHDFIARVVATMRARDQTSGREIAAQIFAAVVPSAALYSASLAQVVSFFLEDANTEAREKVLALSKSKEANASTELMGYVREALRLNPAIPGFYRTAGREVAFGAENIQAFEVVYASLTAANRDVNAFGPDPNVPVYNRQGNEPILGLGNTGCASEKFIAATVGPVLSEILSLKGVKRAPNRSGRFNDFQENWQEYPRKQYIDTRGAVSPFPDSLILQYQTA